MGVKLLIDGDVIAYRAGFATEKTKYLTTEANGQNGTVYESAADAKQAGQRDHVLWSRKDAQPEDQALLITDVMLKDIRERYAAEKPKVQVFLSGVGNFRYGVATRAEYKGNRAGTAKPVHLKAIREHLVKKGALVSNGEEADDLIGIAASSSPEASIVCSIDKDLMQLPGRHYNFVTKEEVRVSPREAAINLYAQALSGDSVDNIPGLPGIGPVKARKLLAECESPYGAWQVVLEAYAKEFGAELGYKFALEAASLVYVRRKPNEQFTPPAVYSRRKAEQKGEVA